MNFIDIGLFTLIIIGILVKIVRNMIFIVLRVVADLILVLFMDDVVQFLNSIEYFEMILWFTVMIIVIVAGNSL
jgi:hypothetical protein